MLRIQNITAVYHCEQARFVLAHQTSYRRQTDSIAALLGAGATTDGIDLPTGYDAIDQLLLGRLK